MENEQSDMYHFLLCYEHPCFEPTIIKCNCWEELLTFFSTNFGNIEQNINECLTSPSYNSDGFGDDEHGLHDTLIWCGLCMKNNEIRFNDHLFLFKSEQKAKKIYKFIFDLIITKSIKYDSTLNEEINDLNYGTNEILFDQLEQDDKENCDHIYYSGGPYSCGNSLMACLNKKNG